jgi:membrane protein required for colicin V production
MTTFDWLMLMLLVASVALAVRRALVYEALSVFTWVLIFFLSMLIAPDLTRLLFSPSSAQQEHYAVSFVLVIMVWVMIGALYIYMLTGGAKVRPPGGALSAVLGLVRGIVLLLAATVVITMTTLKEQSWWYSSGGANALTVTLQAIKPLLPRRFARKMD